jgi:hypothetical protein
MPGYLESLSSNYGGDSIPQNASLFNVIRYLIWAYSFKFGIYFFLLGVLLERSIGKKKIIVFSVIGFVYIASAYIEIPIKASLFFGIMGGTITILALILFWMIPQTGIIKNNLYEYIGIYFIINAIYNLCGLTGVKCFALYPEKMIEYNLQDLAFSFTDHIIIELTVGFIFLVISKIEQTGENK